MTNAVQQLQPFLNWVQRKHGPEVARLCADAARENGCPGAEPPFGLLDEVLKRLQSKQTLAAQKLGELHFNS